MMQTEQVIIRPLINEKSNELNAKLNRYTFLVKKTANKNQIKNCVEKYFNVKVVSVNTVLLPGKTKRMGKNVVKTQFRKKAYVSLKENQKIELFKGI